MQQPDMMKKRKRNLLFLPINVQIYSSSQLMYIRQRRATSGPAISISSAFSFCEREIRAVFNWVCASFMAESNPNPIAGDDEEQEEGGQVVLFNATRHEHELLLFEGLPTYTCSGCKEKGANIGYKCNINSDRPSSSCKNFTLHQLCATLPDAYQHPFLSDVSFKFRPKTIFPHRCNACWDEVKGYVFETERRHLRPELRLHPLCMALPKILDYSRHANHKLKFLTGDLKDKEYTCSVCDSQIESGGWRYRCEEVACKVYVDLSCAKIDIFGLSDHGIERIAPVSRSRSRRGSVATFVKSVMNGVVYALNN